MNISLVKFHAQFIPFPTITIAWDYTLDITFAWGMWGINIEIKH